MSTPNDLIRAESGQRAQWIAHTLDLPVDPALLDLTGFLTRAATPRILRITAIDRAGKTSKILFAQGFAGTLPFTDNTFDQVVACFSAHTSASPLDQIREAARVTRSGGKIAVIDLAAPEDPILAVRYNEIETLRNPAHVETLSEAGLQTLLGSAQLVGIESVSRDVETNLFRWFEVVSTSRANQQIVLDRLRAELAGGKITGLRPFLCDYDLMFTQRWVITIGAKV